MRSIVTDTNESVYSMKRALAILVRARIHTPRKPLQALEHGEDIQLVTPAGSCKAHDKLFATLTLHHT